MLHCINATVTTNESPETVIEEFQTRLGQAGLSKLVEVDLTPINGGISLDRICSLEPGNGYADEALQILMSLCDDYHKSIELHPYPLDDKTCKERLVGWYARNGFIGVASDNSVMRRNTLPQQ